MANLKDTIEQHAKEILFGAHSINQPKEPMTAEKLMRILGDTLELMPEADPVFNMRMHYPFGGLNFQEFNKRKLPDTFKPYIQIGGFRVFESNVSIPKFQLSEKVTVSDEFRQEMNAWLADFFGGEPVLPDDTVLVMGNAMIINSVIKNSLKANL